MLKKISLIVVLSIIMLSGIVLAEETLNIVVWPGYHSPELMNDFENEFGVNIEVAEIGTYDEMLTYLDENPGKVDVLIFGELIMPELIQSGRLMPLDKSLIPNFKNADPMFLNLGYDPGNKYTLVYHYVYVGLAYNKDNLTEEEATLQNYFEPSEKLRGRIITFPNPRFNIGFAMKYMGKSFNDMNNDDLELSKMLLSNLKENATPDSGDLERGIYQPIVAINEGKADLTIWFYETQESVAAVLGDLNVNFGFKIPEEGANMGTDAMCIPTAAVNSELAHKFINFFYDPDNAAKSVSYTGYPTPVEGVAERIEASFAERIYLPMDILRKCEFPMPLQAGEDEIFTQIWEEIFQ